MQSVSYVMPTAVRASSMKEFREGLERVSLSSIAYHMFDARLRLEKGDNDFSRWLEQSLGENRLADALRKVDPYTFTQDGLRRRLLSLVDQRLQEE